MFTVKFEDKTAQKGPFPSRVHLGVEGQERLFMGNWDHLIWREGGGWGGVVYPSLLPSRACVQQTEALFCAPQGEIIPTVGQHRKASLVSLERAVLQ